MFYIMRGRNVHGGLSEKIPVFQKIAKTCYFHLFFGFFTKTALRILLKLGQNVLCVITDHLHKTACQNLFPFSRFCILTAVKTRKNAFLDELLVLRGNNVLTKFLNGSIRKVLLKVIFEYILISRQFQVQSKSSLLLGGPRKFTCSSTFYMP